jgi:hypothetical protein
MPKHATVVLRFDKRVPVFIVQISAVLTAIGGDPTMFPSPDPLLSDVQDHLDALADAEALARGRTIGAASARDDALQVVKDDARALVAYVQVRCNLSPEAAAAIAEAAGMRLKTATPRSKPLLQIKRVSPGAVRIIARAARKGQKTFYDWAYSADGGHSWLALQSTTGASTELAGLTALTTYAFRFRKVDRSGPGAWSDVVTFILV